MYMIDTTPPPSYERAMAELENLKKQLPLSPEQLNKVHAALGDKLAEALARDDLKKAVEKLTSDAVSLDKHFQTVGEHLETFDQNGFKYKDGSSVEKFKPSWEGFHASYGKIIWGSREAASMNAANISIFNEVTIPILKDKTKSLAIKKAALKEFLEIKDGANAKELPRIAQEQKDSFQILSGNITAFKKKYTAIAALIKENLTDKKEELLAKLELLKVEIAAVDLKITLAAIGLGLAIFGTITGVTVAFAFLGLGFLLALFSAIGTVVALTYLIKLMKERAEFSQKRAALEAEIAKVAASLNNVISAQTKLEAASKTVDEMVATIVDISAVWDCVFKDATMILTKLEAADKIGMGFDNLIHTIEHGYLALQDGLEKYGALIETSGVESFK